ncbi:hypothetical protein Goshw_007049 [Gossypium schwendimanii]|uniref:TF-B3 domain-containing protein n=1 Tax=Gossypium schwendimanii TaxID=34291 RepID=A0A7J9LLM1_GOSSC|nr:hypothetical protein [Gossypium schwendimanii]
MFLQRVPKKFTEKFREKLLGTIHLRGPIGFMWTVEVEKMFNHVVFQNGWPTFVEEHRLEKADLLVFRYIGNSAFNVVIFDSSGCVREGSYFVREHTNACSNDGCLLDKEDGEDCEDIIDLEKPHIQKRKIKKGRGRTSSKAVDADNRHQSKAREDKQPRVGKSAVEREVLIDGDDYEDIIDLEKIHKQKKIKKRRGKPSSKAVDTNNHHQSKATEKKRPRVIKSAVEGEVSIDEPDGAPGCAMEDCVEQNLQGSYSLYFILKRREITKEEKQRPRKLSRQYPSTRPSFTLVMKDSHVYNNLIEIPSMQTIPKRWHQRYMFGDVRRTLLRVPPQNKVRDVRIRSSIWGTAFTRGWAKFVLDNNLGSHDTCVFELSDEGKANGYTMVFDVIIFRVLDEIVPLKKFLRTQTRTAWF